MTTQALFGDYLAQGEEEVSIRVKASVDSIKPVNLFNGIKAVVAYNFTDKLAVLLLHVSVVILLVRAATVELKVHLRAEAYHVVVEELRAII
ncbi:MAG: hypothetical protein AB1576_05880 [Bacillota bacterium]